MSFGRVFLLSVVAGFALVVVPAAVSRIASAPTSEPGAQEKPAKPRPAMAGVALGPGITVRDQLNVAEIATLGAQGIRTIIDLRPDGEARDQPTSLAIGTAARAAGLEFAYVPTPHGDIPDAVVVDLARTLATAAHPVVLYCRSGKRAARVWALAEASRRDGAPPDAIAAAVRGAGQPIDDLAPRIAARATARAAQTANR